MADRNKDDEYEQMLEQAISKIAVYSDEWTNRLPSDPGITILENLTAFQLLLLQKIRKTPELVRPVLPGLLGAEAIHGACAKVLLGAYDSGGQRTFAKDEKFYLGNLCFETDRKIHLPRGRMRKVYREHQGSLKEIEELRSGNPLTAPIFGKSPQVGDAVYLLFDGPYGEAGGEARLYVNAQPAFLRNPPDAGYPVVFADARWSYYTKEGYRDAECRDETNVFLVSGEIQLRLGSLPPALGTMSGEEGYLLKCELLREEYDQTPCVKQIDGPLFEVYERDSKAVSYELAMEESREFLDKMTALCRKDSDSYLFVYAGNNRDGYQACQEPFADVSGRRGGMDSSMYADSGTCICKGGGRGHTVKIVYMKKEVAVQKMLGILYGYDNQEFELGLPGEAVPETLEIMVEMGSGEKQRSFFFSPLESGIGDVRYEYDSEKKVLRVLDAGDFEGGVVSVSRYAIYHGADGNVLPENCFLRLGADREEVYRNPICGQGGRRTESFEETAERMRKRLLLPGTLVTASDYEQMTRLVPGLCIHKVYACQGEGIRDIRVYVLPYGEEKRPKLTSLYSRQIQRYLEDRRLLGTKIHILEPVFIAIDVHAVITVKVQYADVREEIEKTIRQELDYVNRGKGFYNTVSRRHIRQALEQMPCMDEVQELTILHSGIRETANRKQMAGAKSEGEDIRLPEGGLCYAGKVKLIIKRGSVI